jgi:hypothetical protein
MDITRRRDQANCQGLECLADLRVADFTQVEAGSFSMLETCSDRSSLLPPSWRDMSERELQLVDTRRFVDGRTPWQHRISTSHAVMR